jgi:hypothetical protein
MDSVKNMQVREITKESTIPRYNSYGRDGSKIKEREKRD